MNPLCFNLFAFKLLPEIPKLAASLINDIGAMVFVTKSLPRNKEMIRFLAPPRLAAKQAVK